MKRYENCIYAISPSSSSDLPLLQADKIFSTPLVVGQTESNSGLGGAAIQLKLNYVCIPEIEV